MVTRKENITVSLDESKLRFFISMINILDNCITKEGIDQQLYGELINNYYDKNN